MVNWFGPEGFETYVSDTLITQLVTLYDKYGNKKWEKSITYEPLGFGEMSPYYPVWLSDNGKIATLGMCLESNRHIPYIVIYDSTGIEVTSYRFDIDTGYFLPKVNFSPDGYTFEYENRYGNKIIYNINTFQIQKINSFPEINHK